MIPFYCKTAAQGSERIPQHSYRQAKVIASPEIEMAELLHGT
jgi:hypothetical protein